MARAHGPTLVDPFDVAVDRYERRERAQDRIRMVGLLQTAVSGFGVLVGMLAFVAIAPWGLLTGDPGITMLLGGIGSAIAAFFFALSLPGLAAGVGLLTGRGWARTLAIVLALFQLFHIPVGTALGAFTLFVLLQDDVRECFEPSA